MINIDLIIHHEKESNWANYLRGLRENDWVRTIAESMYDVHDIHTYTSWLMYYLGSKNKDEFITIAVRMGCPMLTKRMDHINAATMWQESNISKSPKELCWHVYQISVV